MSRIWFITGISSGLGKSLFEEVIKTGDIAIGTFRKTEQVEEFNQRNLTNAHTYKMDVTKIEDIHFVYNSILEKYNKIDVLVNNAGIGFAGAIEETSIEDTRRILETNFFGALNVTQTFLPMFRKNKSGHIFQISSHGGIRSFAGFGIYNASKYALEGFSEALAQEIAPLGIKLTIVEPGPFRTNFASTEFGFASSIIKDYNSTAGAFRERMKSVNGKQEGDPQKAAKAIIQMSNSEKPSLRLPLGKIAIAVITSKLESVQNDLLLNKDLSESTVY
ncbi:MAG: oxidoreductase [Leptospiraceae bacterium]|nr:oxidoreductase [Leptospiraceae bacterium]